MSITTTTHLNFRGDARTALEFYQSVFGGQMSIATYGDFGMPEDSPSADSIVFGQLESEDGFRIMAYDILGAPAGPVDGFTRREHGVTITDRPFFVSVRGASLDEVRAYWDKLAVHALVIEPFATSAWSPGFGMLTDGFGVTWILDVAADYRAN